MDRIHVDGVSMQVSDLTFSPDSPQALVKQVRFTTAGAPDPRLIAAHYTPLEFAVSGQRFFGLFRLVSATPVRSTTEFLYEGTGRPAWSEAEETVPAV